MDSKVELHPWDDGNLLIKGDFTLDQLVPFFGKDSRVLAVDFEDIIFTDQAFKKMLDFFSLKRSMEFTFRRCQLDDRKIKMLIDVFHNLWGLHFTGNELSAESFLALAEALRGNRTIMFFTFDQTLPIDLPVSTFLETMGSNYKLESVRLISSETTLSKAAQEVLWDSNIRNIHAYKIGSLTFTYGAEWDDLITRRDQRRISLQTRCAALIHEKELDYSILPKMVQETASLNRDPYLDC